MSRDESCDWYHGKISRIDAENILLEGDFAGDRGGSKKINNFFIVHLSESQISNADGIFLVRESSSAANNYVLSVYYDTQFWHYQVQQHGEDAFFSIDGQLPIHHGLDDLIDYYRSTKTNLCTKLKNFVKKLPPPVESRRHGKQNLLHRATKHDRLVVVKEMMKTTHRNLDAKDEFGMTAVHLACKNRVNPEIMKLLIERGATLTSRDSSGNTPLHVSPIIESQACVNELFYVAIPVRMRKRVPRDGRATRRGQQKLDPVEEQRNRLGAVALRSESGKSRHCEVSAGE